MTPSLDFGLAGPAAASAARHLAAFVASEPSTVAAFELTSGRLWGGLAAVVALAGSILGALAHRRGEAKVARTSRAERALLAGALGTLLGAVVVARADHGLGSGQGLGGGVLGMVFGLTSLLLGVWAKRRGAR